MIFIADTGKNEFSRELSTIIHKLSTDTHKYVENDVEKLRRREGKAKRPKTQSVMCAPKKLEKQGNFGRSQKAVLGGGLWVLQKWKSHPQFT